MKLGLKKKLFFFSRNIDFKGFFVLSDHPRAQKIQPDALNVDHRIFTCRLTATQRQCEDPEVEEVRICPVANTEHVCALLSLFTM